MPSELTPVERPGPVSITGASWLPSPGGIQGATGSTGPVVSAVNEAWCQTTQTMGVEYVRVPPWTKPASLDQAGLTQFSATDNVYSTRLAAVITIHTKREKVYLSVGTSAFTQLQKLQLAADSTDQYAQSYGVVSGFIMGPAGSINTIQPYIKSEKWDDVIHPTEYDITQIGSSEGYYDTSTLMWADSTDTASPLGEYVNSREMWRTPGEGTAFADVSHMYKVPVASNWPSKMNGGYNTSAEPAWNNLAAGRDHLIVWLEYLINTGFCASKINNRFSIPLPKVSNGYSWLQDGDRVAQNIYYNTAFHDYT